MKNGTLLRAAAGLIALTAVPAWSVPVAVDTTSPANGFTDLFSATFDGALSPCTPSDPAWCAFFNGKPGPNRNIVITPTPTGAVNAVPIGLTPVPAAGSYLDLEVNGARTQVTISGGTVAIPPISLTIQGGTPNSTVVNAGGAGVVFSSTPQVAALDANGRAEFLVNLAPALAVDFSTFSIITAPPNGSCAGPLCAIIPILTLDMVKYRLVIDYDPTFTYFTADYIGQTGNNSILSITMNSVAPEITVNGSVTFGDVTELTSTTQTVTVTNSGGANLLLGAVGLADGLAAPFSLANDNCTGATVAPAATCTFGVTFAPGSVNSFSDTLDIPSNDPDEPTVSVAVSGTGTAQAVPNISVTDSVAPATDLAVPFGNTGVGVVADETVVVTNEGNADLVLGTIASANGLVAPFSIVADSCSGQTIVPAASCSFDVRFEPTGAGAFVDSFDIPSNDAADPTVTISVSGGGTSLAQPEITVTDNTLPADDLIAGFGNVTVGTTRDRTITVTNTGSADLTVGAVGGSNPLAAPFSVVTDNCSSEVLTASASCTVLIRYTPPTTGAASDSLDIPSSDADEPTVTVSVTGTGIAEGDGGTGTPRPDGADGGFMAIDPATLLLLGGAAGYGWRRRRLR